MEVATKIEMVIPLWGLASAGFIVFGWGVKMHIDNLLLKKDLAILNKDIGLINKEIKEIKELLFHQIRPNHD